GARSGWAFSAIITPRDNALRESRRATPKDLSCVHTNSLFTAGPTRHQATVVSSVVFHNAAPARGAVARAAGQPAPADVRDKPVLLTVSPPHPVRVRDRADAAPHRAQGGGGSSQPRGCPADDLHVREKRAVARLAHPARRQPRKEPTRQWRADGPCRAAVTAAWRRWPSDFATAWPAAPPDAVQAGARPAVDAGADVALPSREAGGAAAGDDSVLAANLDDAAAHAGHEPLRAALRHRGGPQLLGAAAGGRRAEEHPGPRGAFRPRDRGTPARGEARGARQRSDLRADGARPAGLL
ncbi:hypothetical protein T484DRAFT_1887018, partial [Baffinella frigidus]